MSKRKISVCRDNDGTFVTNINGASFYQNDSAMIKMFEGLTPEMGPIEFEFDLPDVQVFFSGFPLDPSDGKQFRLFVTMRDIAQYKRFLLFISKVTIINGNVKNTEIVWRTEE